MTEEEKRALAQQIFAQETARLSSHSPLDAARADLASSLRRSEARKKAYSSLAQNGITLEQYQEAYDEAFLRGQADCLTYNFSFFYAAAAIAYHEAFQSDPDGTAAFIRALPNMPEGVTDSRGLLKLCLEETGVDVSYADPPKVEVRATRKDREAVERIRRTGITQKDLQRQRENGYSDGRRTPFFLSSCYATVALELHKEHSMNAQEIEQFLERVSEIQDDEIDTASIMERAKDEAGVDVSDVSRRSPEDLGLTISP